MLPSSDCGQITGGVYEQLSTLGLPNCLERRLRQLAEAEQAGTGQARNRRGCRDKRPRRMGSHPAHPRPTRWGLLSCNKGPGLQGTPMSATWSWETMLQCERWEQAAAVAPQGTSSLLGEFPAAGR